mmetsp:Transcript_14442/g.33521  ORF Transcript_14442/g.33521 Transcript_14442/m.33521 type:complete len:226 (-) Transcript_14442:15-692(-)
MRVTEDATKPTIPMGASVSGMSWSTGASASSESSLSCCCCCCRSWCSSCRCTAEDWRSACRLWGNNRGASLSLLSLRIIRIDVTKQPTPTAKANPSSTTIRASTTECPTGACGFDGSVASSRIVSTNAAAAAVLVLPCTSGRGAPVTWSKARWKPHGSAWIEDGSSSMDVLQTRLIDAFRTQSATLTALFSLSPRSKKWFCTIHTPPSKAGHSAQPHAGTGYDPH